MQTSSFKVQASSMAEQRAPSDWDWGLFTPRFLREAFPLGAAYPLIALWQFHHVAFLGFTEEILDKTRPWRRCEGGRHIS